MIADHLQGDDSAAVVVGDHSRSWYRDANYLVEVLLVCLELGKKPVYIFEKGFYSTLCRANPAVPEMPGIVAFDCADPLAELYLKTATAAFVFTPRVDKRYRPVDMLEALGTPRVLIDGNGVAKYAEGSTD